MTDDATVLEASSLNGVLGAASPRSLQGRILPGLFQLLGALGLPGFWPHHPSLCLVFIWASALLSSLLSLMKTLVSGLRLSFIIQNVLILFLSSLLLQRP